MYGVYSQARTDLLGNPGTPVWDFGWDILLILDACRVDLIDEVGGEYEFIPTNGVDSIFSVASLSETWIERTFGREFEDDVRETAYVTGNPFTDKVEFQSTPKLLDEVWKYGWDNEKSTIPARVLTERAVHVWRNEEPERMIVHYMQPHTPFVNYPEIGDYKGPGDFGDGFSDMWNRVGDEYDAETVWEAYVDNLRYVLDDVEILLSNVDADTVAISADHGNAIGEWGAYGHMPHILLPCIREVPWVETSAEDKRTIEGRPKPEPVDEGDVDERLRALGYKE